MVDRIAICSLSCRYPDATLPRQLWRNLMNGRRSFRSIPTQRLPLADYNVSCIGVEDSITQVPAALISDWVFHRANFRVPLKSFESTDLTHWLTLELASNALEDVVQKIDTRNTAVIIANTLTGEFSRANLTRLRLPFLNEILTEVLNDVGSSQADAIQQSFSEAIKARFPAPTEDMLSGGLANTIAGRIANHFNFNGGAYTVDGACSSSLLAVINAAELLEAGATDTVIAGAVDLSLDPFELVGFSRNGALSKTRMRVFDERSDGFWPGEGAAVAVMMREKDAKERGVPVLAVLRGWGMSTDGAGGLTRPNDEGQHLACTRALEKAGIAPSDVAYIEAHGTGTSIGDTTEIRSLACLTEDLKTPLPIGSVKANIGHTKAAAGFAGLTKIVQSFREGAIPPHVTCDIPNTAFAEIDGCLRPLEAPLLLEQKAIAGVSSFGFGGINAHVLLERSPQAASPPRSFRYASITSDQAVELFAFSCDTPDDLIQELKRIHPLAATASVAELTDLAQDVATRVTPGEVRLAFSASDGSELSNRIDAVLKWLSGDISKPIWLHATLDGKRKYVCLLFSGQASPVRKVSMQWCRRFPEIAALAKQLLVKPQNGDKNTMIAQPAITFSNLAGRCLLDRLGVEADDAIGHSLGEIASMAWAGMLTPADALSLATRRGADMARFGMAGGIMVRIALPESDCVALAKGTGCEIACHNSPTETVMAGARAAINALTQKAQWGGVEVAVLGTSHAFHSSDMLPAVEPFSKTLSEFSFSQPERTFTSTITGAPWDETADPRVLLREQLTTSVEFLRAVQQHDPETTIMIECGAGAGMSRLARQCGFDAWPMDTQGEDFRALIDVFAALFVAGQDLKLNELFDGRGFYPLRNLKPPVLLENPCGRKSSPSKPAEVKNDTVQTTEVVEIYQDASSNTLTSEDLAIEGTLIEAVLATVAEEIGIATTEIEPTARFQSDLHMNSLSVMRVVMAAARALRLQPPASPTDFADGTPADLAEALLEIKALGRDGMPTTRVKGVRRWFTTFAMSWDTIQPPTALLQSTPLESERTLRLELDVLDQREAEKLMRRLREVGEQDVVRLEVIHDGLPVMAMLRSLWLENSFPTIVAIDRNGKSLADMRIDQLCQTATAGFHAFRLADNSAVEVPVFRRTLVERRPIKNAGASDTILAVGCHRGIGAECALRLGAGGAEVVFVGRSLETHPDVLETLAIADERGIRARYVQADLGDREAIEAAVKNGGLRGIAPDVMLYAAGVNEPRKLKDLDDVTIHATLQPKVFGLALMLDLYKESLRQVIAFGSIIGQLGLEGEAHYALANEMQSAHLADFAGLHPDIACLSLEWTIWSGIGMGERLGTVERLEAIGVDALPFDKAIQIFDDLVSTGATGTICVTGRFGSQYDLGDMYSSGAPLRFIDEIRLYYPDCELIVETKLLPGRDLYLEDHKVSGLRFMPGVMGLEAMAQAARRLDPEISLHDIRDISFARAMCIPDEGLIIRVAVLKNEAGDIEAVIRSDEDNFFDVYMTARFAQSRPSSTQIASTEGQRVCLQSSKELYGPLFFHGETFACIDQVLSASSRKVEVSLLSAPQTRLFGAYEPQTMLLGHPAINDTGMHMLQLALPHIRVLPVSVAHVERFGDPANAIKVVGTENWSRGGQYSFNILSYDAEGKCIYAWTDVRFTTVGMIEIDPILEIAPELVGVTVERMAREALDDEIRVAIVRGEATPQQTRRALALEQLGLIDQVRRRTDGRMLLTGGCGTVSIAHTQDTSFAVHGSRRLSCDLVDLSETMPEGFDHRAFSEGELRRKLGSTAPFAVRDQEPCDIMHAVFSSLSLHVSIAAQNIPQMVMEAKEPAE